MTSGPVTTGPAPLEGRPEPTARRAAFDEHHPPARELINDCVHCGFCLPTCPTYQLWGEEMDSPRGRILLMDAAERGELDLTDQLVGHWDACLGCMACVPACPSGVQYNRLIEQTRQQVERRYRRSWQQRALRTAIFAMLPYRGRMRAAAALLAAYNASGARGAVRRSGVLARLPHRLRRLDDLAPALDLAAMRARTPARTAPSGPRRARVAMLTGCVQDAFYAEVNAATARVLAAYGCEVLAPREQGCCGALEIHSGREASALHRARALIALLEPLEVDMVVVNAAGCGSSMKEYAMLLEDDPGWRDRATAFATRVRDVSEVLDELGAPEGVLQPLQLRVGYHDACHLGHAQGVRLQPRALLSAIPGVEVVPIAEGDMCCGSAGIYNLVQPDAADALGERKAANVLRADVDALAAGNGGCLLQIGAALRRAGRPLPAFHPVELLDASLRGVGSDELLRQRTLREAGPRGFLGGRHARS
ncbi:MAG: (Fe-S)-binding protein [Candidatus Dormibacteria bacterium]